MSSPTGLPPNPPSHLLAWGRRGSLIAPGCSLIQADGVKINCPDLKCSRVDEDECARLGKAREKDDARALAGGVCKKVRGQSVNEHKSAGVTASLQRTGRDTGVKVGLIADNVDVGRGRKQKRIAFVKGVAPCGGAGEEK